jgi:hypothetical protein
MIGNIIAGIFSVGTAPLTEYLSVGHQTSPYISVYPWSTSTGYGTRYTNPASLPAGQGYGVAFDPAATNIISVNGNSPYIAGYPWSSSGFGTRYANPATALQQADQGNFNQNGTAIAVGAAFYPYIYAYAFSSGFGSKYADPATPPGGGGTNAIWNSAGTNIAMGSGANPYIYAWAWSSGFGSKYSNPATLPAGYANNVGWNPAGTAIAAGHTNSPYVTAYPWSAGFGTKYANPATEPGTPSYAIDFA